MSPTDALSVASGGVVGLALGLVGGGGSILSVPLMVYAVGVPSPHVAVGTSALAVAASALASLRQHARKGHVKWRCALVFAAAGILGTLAGSSLAKAVDGQRLLALFGVLMLVVGALMLRPRKGEGDAGVRLTVLTARHLVPWLVATGLAVGALSGFFGIGGGFLIVPALMLATGMPLPHAIATSLVAVTAFGMATAGSYAVSGLVDWRLAALFIPGGIAGGFVGMQLGRALAGRKRALTTTFAAVVLAAGAYVVSRGFQAMS